MTGIPIGARFMLMSALGFSLMGACVKELVHRGIPVLEIIAARALVSCAISYVDIKRKKISCWGNNKLLLAARGVVGTLALICVFYAVSTLPLAEATLLQHLNPVFTALLAFLLLKERINLFTVVCIILSLVGLIAMIQPELLLGHIASNPDRLPVFGIFAALAGAFGSGVAYVIVRRLARTEDASVIIFYFPFIALPVSCFLMGTDFILPNGMDWILLILVGILTQIGQLGLTKAMKMEKAAKAMAYSYVQVVFSALLGIAFFSEIPTLGTLLGAFFIIGGALINLRGK